MPDLLEIAQIAVSFAMNAGAEFAEACCSRSRHLGVIVENTSIRECESVRESGLAVRAYIAGGIGYAVTDRLDAAAVRACAASAIALARATHPDPDFVALPPPAPAAGSVRGLYDQRVAGLEARTVVEWCRRGIEEARSVDGAVALSGGGDAAVTETAVVSSTGVALLRRGTRLGIGFSAVVRRGDDVGAFSEEDEARRLADFCPEGVAAAATRAAQRFLGARPMRTAILPVVLGPLVAMPLVRAALQAASAESVQRGRSCMAGREGAQVASPVLTITEEPFIPAGLRSMARDGQGLPKQQRRLLDCGVLTTYLHNSYTAHKAGVPNTAHATWGGPGGPGIALSNITPALGDRTEAELIAEINDGLYIEEAEIAPDPVTGEISATVDFGYKIERGELAYPVSTTMIGCNLFELLGAIDAVSSDYRAEPGEILPAMRVRDLQVIGAR